jgi:hypothetical protein
MPTQLCFYSKTFLLMLIYVLLLVSPTSKAESSLLKPFTTDGCSVFPDGTLAHKELWLSCCTAHDLAYWQGGTYEERLQADQALEICVTQVGEPRIAKLMLAGVRVGGTPYLPTSFRWGYGWPYPRLYKALSDEERRQITLLKESVLINVR